MVHAQANILEPVGLSCLKICRKIEKEKVRSSGKKIVPSKPPFHKDEAKIECIKEEVFPSPPVISIRSPQIEDDELEEECPQERTYRSRLNELE